MQILHKLCVITLWISLGIALSACSAPRIHDYSANQPTLTPEQFFNGQLSAHGVLKNRQGKVTRWFNATIAAHWQNGIGTLDEAFVFSDGERQTRVWTLTPLPNSDPEIKRYSATAGDVKGEATVEVSGNAMFLKYTLMVPYKGKTLAVNIDDRMYQVNDDTIINQSVMTKWGFKVGEILLTIRRN